jgi:serine/threonine-protein kinase
MGPYGGYDDRRTQALAAQRGGPATAMMPPADDRYDGYDDYDRPDRRQRKNRASTVLLVLAGVLVLIGAIFIGRAMFNDPPEGTEVPVLAGQSYQDAADLAENVDLRVERGEDMACENHPEDTVCETDPPAGTEVEAGTVITLHMSTGAPPVTVPSVLGDDFESASGELKDLGLEVAQETEETRDSEPGTVLAQDPEGGTEVQRGATVTLTVAVEPNTVAVPDVVGMSETQAREKLQGFNVTTERRRDDSREPDTVISQDPRAGSSAEPGSLIHLIIAEPSDEPQQFQIPPDIVGQNFHAVRNQLQDWGLQVSANGPSGPHAIVTGSNPAPGQLVREGDRVVLTTERGGDDGGDGGDSDGDNGGDDGNGNGNNGNGNGGWVGGLPGGGGN